MSAESGEVVFEPMARILKLLGEELITNEIIAIVELVKNSYDACAERVTVDLKNVDDREIGVIRILDDGIGMNLDTVLNAWLKPGTDIKKREKGINNMNKNCERPVLGEKGVGRFAAQKLGSLINLITKTKDDVYENNLEVNWNLFDEKSMLSDVKSYYWQSKPKYFKGKKHGTIVEITFLQKNWSKIMVKNLNQQLNMLNTPFPSKDIFKVKLSSNKYTSELKDPPTLKEIQKNGVYSFEAEINKEGFLSGKYEFNNIAFPQFKHTKFFNEFIMENDTDHFPEARKPISGPFSLMFSAWDLDAATLRETVTRSYYYSTIRPYCGIKVYRDGFRVWPYGEPDDDWLSMDARRVNYPTVRLSRNQTVGIINISLNNNPELRDKTDREGLIDTSELEDFKHIIKICLTLFENERRLDKDKVDKLRERKYIDDIVYLAINNLRNKIVKNEHNSIYEKEIKNIESSYNKRVRDISNTYLVSAGLGIAYMLPVHDIYDNIGSIEDNIKNILKEKRLKISIREELLNTLKYVEIIREATKGVRFISRRGGLENHKLSNIAKEAISMINYRFKNENVKFKDIEILEDSRIKCRKNLIIISLLNLIDNSIYWVKAKSKADWIIKIIIDRDEIGRPRIIVCDKGPGIKDTLEAIVQPFFSRKPNGSGLGLYIVQEIMKMHEGDIGILFEGDHPDIWPGANVAIFFKEADLEE